MAFNMTLDQEEIEKAIDIHVRSLVPGLSPDQTIGITLSATRGPSGFTAAIDLNPTTETAAVATAAASAPKEEVVKAAPKKVQTSGTKPLGIAAKAAEAKAETAKAEEAAPVEETVAEDTAEAAAEPAAEAEAAPVEEAPAEVPAETAPRQSLFGNLGKPKN